MPNLEKIKGYVHQGSYKDLEYQYAKHEGTDDQYLIDLERAIRETYGQIKKRLNSSELWQAIGSACGDAVNRKK